MLGETGTGEDLLGPAKLTPTELRDATSAAAGRPVTAATASVAPIAYDWGSPATAGLWRVDVRDDAGELQPVYTFFVKLLRNTRLWPGLAMMPTELRAEFVDFYPWRSDLDMHDCGIGAVLPAGLRQPALHHVGRPDADHVALWWEFIDQRSGPWQLADYHRAAFLLGQLAARRREGAAVNDALPPVARNHGSSLRYYTERRIKHGVLPALRDGHLWHHPVVAAALSQVSDPGLPAAMLALGERLPRILDLLERLPRTFAHGDASPQNLLLPAAEPGTIVVIDWGFGSLLPVGFDLGQLLAGLAHAGETDPADLAGIDAVILPGYIDGLASEGYDADPQTVRTGYVGGMAARSALATLPVELLSGPPDPAVTELFVRRLRLARVLVDMAAGLPV
jgi:hypothetical protein